MSFCQTCAPREWTDEVRNDDAPAENGTRPRGKRSPLTAAQQSLAARYLPMAKSLAKPMKRTWPNEWPEFESAALLALVEAAQSFDPSRNVKFGTFARFRIWGALRDVQRSLIMAGWNADFLHAPSVFSITSDSEEHGRVLFSEPDPPVGEDAESAEFVDAWLRKLPPTHESACREIFVNGLNNCEAADRLRCSKSRLSYVRRESLVLLKDAYEYDERRLEKKCRPV